jgi:ribose transport system ATP-binding protein
MQLVEIAKAICTESKVLIMDEPTATLTSKEIAVLFTIINRLKEKGVTIIYISHRLAEIFEIGDRVTVLRNGEKVGTRPLADVTVPELVHMMVGREIEEQYPFREDVVPGEVMFEAQEIEYAGGDHRISFSVRRGEILGIAGLVGSGRTETMRAIFGADRKIGGRVCLDGQEITIKHPQDAVRHGIGFLTEDRKGQGLILEMPCYVNITITDTARISKGGLLRRDVERSVSKRLVDDLDIRTPSVDQLVGNLSGGNQQKIVIAKWLFRNMKFLIFDEPTRGVDVGAKHEIYSLLWDLAAQGKGIVVVSSDLLELIGICHRIIVFSRGKVAGTVGRDEFDQEKILSLAYSEHIHNNYYAAGESRE